MFSFATFFPQRKLRKEGAKTFSSSLKKKF
jgi:hypothetical protein